MEGTEGDRTHHGTQQERIGSTLQSPEPNKAEKDNKKATSPAESLIEKIGPKNAESVSILFGAMI